jgi:hypothetical protein
VHALTLELLQTLQGMGSRVHMMEECERWTGSWIEVEALYMSENGTGDMEEGEGNAVESLNNKA